MSSVVEIRCNGEQIQQVRTWDTPIPRKGDMVQVYHDRDFADDDPRQGGWFRVREVCTVVTIGMRLVYLICDREVAPKGLFKK